METKPFEGNTTLTAIMFDSQARISIALFKRFVHIISHYNEISQRNRFNTPFPTIVHSTYIEQGIQQIISIFGKQQHGMTFVQVPFLTEEQKRTHVSEDSGKRSIVTFEVMTGDTAADRRQEIVRLFNEGFVDVLIISDAAAVGTNLRGKTGARQFHSMNKGWNVANLKQSIGRGWRKGAHEEIPEEFRILRVFLYSTQSSLADKETPKIDPYVISKGVTTMKFENLLKEHFTPDKLVLSGDMDTIET